MKVIIQIPCFNEAESLGITLSHLPKTLPNISEVEWLIINDGSTDDTVKVARECGVNHVVNFRTNQGLAKAFMAGIQTSLALGADIIVNTDADNQYEANDILKLVEPILNEEADIVIGERPISSTSHFSLLKKGLQKLGSWVVRKISGTNIPDAPSGFRAISRDAAMQLNVFNEYTYTLETIIQAGHKNIATKSIPIRTNEDIRPSRLVKNIWSYVKRSMITIFRIFMVYKPMKFFGTLGNVSLIIGLLLLFRWVVLRLFFFEGLSRVPSLIVASIFIFLGVQLWLFAMLADLFSANRKILEEIQYYIRKENLDEKVVSKKP
ncbi:glycosyltransferase family 2 protein [Robiginitalea aurantiaca]|uniref:Glycosyltransferase family 2 protein n=1 Tax=Robiginitalea aurantiaca TaxID=3056915 RepID=A0ABT7WDZ1_9FLAO|nr:glycosyltransferase family 2 protein [Robiginitalea aurantiaca]MDM9631139.1 glycosyltransferase family 2 protein [Robiginitalea aurantiaca]